MKHLLVAALGMLILAPSSFAILDTNHNGVSDPWERQFNSGVLFPVTFDPQADSDGDGWTNSQEAAAGTNPLDPNPPDGIISPKIVQVSAVLGAPDGNGIPVVITPQAVTVTWPTIVGKQYTLLFSPDLTEGSWLPIGDPFIGNGNDVTYGFEVNGSDKRFWRVATDDTDTDGDGLTNAEEHSLNTSPLQWDSDGDGLSDIDEIVNGFSPGNDDENANGVADGWDDSDQDGYSDLEELAAGTDPRNPASKPDGISTDTLLVRVTDATLFMGMNAMQFGPAPSPVTRIGACGSKNFAFRELKPTAPTSLVITAPIPKFYLGMADTSRFRHDVDFHSTSILSGWSGQVYPDITDLYAHTGTNEELTTSNFRWERSPTGFPNDAAVPYQMQSADDFQVERSMYLTSKPYAAGTPYFELLSYRTGDPETEDFDFSFLTVGPEEGFDWDTYLTSNTISEDDPEFLEATDSISANSAFSSDVGSYRNSHVRTTTSKTKLTDEYTDANLAADVNEALADAHAAASVGASPGITGSAPISGRGIADHQWSDDHINHLKMDALVNFSTTLSQTGVRKVIFLWTELLRPDPASPGGAAPAASLKVRRVIKSNATPFPAGTTVTTDDVEVIHPAEPGHIEIPGPSRVDGPDQLQATQGDPSANPPHSPLKPLLFHSSLTDLTIPVTLEATGDAQIRLWKKQDESFSIVSLPYTLGPEQKAGQTSRPADFLIQGLTPGAVHLALKAQGQEIAYKDIRMIQFDLDADSDNSGTVDATTAEDLLEFTADDPGVIVSCNGGEDADTDGVPNRDDLDNAGEFVPIKFALANLPSADRAIFQYSAGGFGAQRVSGSLRLWKKNGTAARTADDLILSGGPGYTASDLGISGGGTVTLYLETVADLGGTQAISVETAGASDAVKISPLTVEAVSRDKYLAGSFEIPAGWDDLSVSFVNTSSQENLGTYGSLAGGGTTKIYDSVDRIMDEEDMLAGSQPASQKVWFIRNAGNPRKLDFYTCFNSIGTVEIRLAHGGQTVFTRRHQLTTAEDFAETIRYVNDWVKGVGFEFSGGGGPGLMAMGAPSVNGLSDETIEHLTRAALIPFFNVINQVEGLANVATGLFDGARAGINDDWKLLVLIKNGVVTGGGWAWEQAETELNKWRDEPLKRAAELKQMASQICKDWVFGTMLESRPELSTWDGFKNESWKVWKSIQGTAAKSCTVTRNAWKSMVEGLTDWAEDFGDRMMQGAEKAHWDATPWSTTKLDDDINEITRQASYTFGYTLGYLSEQLAVGVLSGGTVKVAGIMAKGGVKAAGLLAARRVLPAVARIHLLKKWTASIAVSVELKIAVERGLAAAADVPISAVIRDSVAEVIERGMARAAFERTAFSSGHILDDVLKSLYIKKLILTPGREVQFWHKFALFFDVMEDQATAQASKGWIKAYDRVLRFEGNVFTGDWSDDLLTLYRAETSAAGRMNLKEAMEDLASVMEQNPNAIYPRIKIPRPSELYDECFCVKGSTTEVGGGSTELILNYVKRERKLPPRSFGTDLSSGPRGHYIGTESFGTPQDTLKAYQINSTWGSDAKVRFTLEKDSLNGKSIVCYSADKENVIFSNRLEPKTRDWPVDTVTHEPLPGGATQFLSEGGIVTKIEVWDNGAWRIEPFN